jgi:hypothetical protein
MKLALDLTAVRTKLALDLKLTAARSNHGSIGIPLAAAA